MEKDVKALIEKERVIAICRKLYGSDLLKCIQALYEGGIRLVEVTFDQMDPDGCSKTIEAIQLLCHHFKGKLHIGAGTVLTKQQVDAAKFAGAEYIISPNTDSKIIQYTKASGLISIPGAFTPSEICMAHDAGADFVKLFPANACSLSYVKDVTAPLSHIKLIATAGVHADNLEEHLKAGFVGAGISSYLCDKKLIESGQFDVLKEHALKVSEIVRNYKG